MDKRMKHLWLFGFALMFCLCMPKTSTAQDLTYTPYLLSSGEYNDNVLFSNVDKTGDFIFDVAPGLEVEYDTERLNLYTFAAIRFKYYATETELDRNDQYYNLLGSYQIAERLKFTGRLYYLKDYTLESTVYDINDTGPDAPNSVSPGIERFYSERKQYNAFGAFNYDLTELTNMELGYRYVKTNYDFVGNADYNRNITELKVLRRLRGYRDQIGAGISYEKYDTDVTNNDNYRFSLIWNHIFSETMTLAVDLGVRYTEETLERNNQQNNNWNGASGIRFFRRGETNMLNIGFRQSLQTSSAGFPVNESRIDGEFQQKISERFLFKIKGYAYVTKENGNSEFDEDTTYFDIIPSLNYLITENHSVSLAYGYTIEHDRTLDDNPNTQRNRIWIAFEFGFPQKW